MRSLLEDEDIYECLDRSIPHHDHLNDVDVSRLSFMAGLHDAGKVSREFQQYLRAEDEVPVLHCRPLWAVLQQPQQSWENWSVEKPGHGKEPVEPQALAACRQIQSLLLSEDRFGWLPEKDLLCYWHAILSHHTWDTLPARNESRYEPERWWLYPWHAEDGYSPCDDIRDLLMGLAAGFPSDHLIAGGRRLPSSSAFLKKFNRLVIEADQLASSGISPNVLAPRARYDWAAWVKSLVEFEITEFKNFRAADGRGRRWKTLLDDLNQGG